MSDFHAMLKEARLPERTVPVCLRGDLAADYEAAERDLKTAQARAAVADSFDNTAVAELVDRIEALQAEMRAHTYTFKFRALPRLWFRAIVAAHPPRRGDDGELDAGDVQLGLNRDTFFDDLLKVSTIEPDMGIDVDTYFKELLAGKKPELADGEWGLLGDKLTDRQYQDLVDTAWMVNRGDVDIPFSHAALRARRDSGDG